MNLLFKNVHFLKMVDLNEILMIVEGTVSKVIISFVYFDLFLQKLNNLLENPDFFGYRMDLEYFIYRFLAIKDPIIQPEKDY
jgi:hypothetical protein